MERGNYWGLKLRDRILKTAERIIERFIRQQVDINELQFGFIPECAITNAIFILKQLQGKYLAKNNFYFAFEDLEKVFDRVSRMLYDGF